MWTDIAKIVWVCIFNAAFQTSLALAEPAPRVPTNASIGCGIPTPGTDGWPIAAPETVGLDSGPLCALAKSFAEVNIHGVLVIRRGMLVYEQYFGGEDQIWGQPLGRVSFDSETKHDLRSVTKSVTSLLLGIAIARKFMGGLDEQVFNFFPEYKDLRTPEKDRILVRHLLTMSTGLEWDENLPYTDPNNSEIQMIRSADRYRFALERSIVAPPGQVWNYNGGSTELLGAIIRKKAGRPLEKFAKDFLFEPLGIADSEWAMYRGIPAAASGLRLRPRDLAKVGQLMLARGEWNGREVVPAQWVDESIAPQIGCAETMYFYGYQWWLGRSWVNKREFVWAAGMGLGGQRVFVVPDLDIVVVITAGLYTNPMQHWMAMRILNRYVLPAVRE